MTDNQLCDKSPTGVHVPVRTGGCSCTFMSRNNRHTRYIICEWCGLYGTEVFWMQDAPPDKTRGPYQVVGEIPGPSTFTWYDK